MLKVSGVSLPRASLPAASFNPDIRELMSRLSITSTSTVNAAEWDELAAQMNGGVFHCHAHAIYEARVSNSEPLFIKAMTPGGQCIGIAVGTLKVSRYWPFSRYGRLVEFPSLPVVGSGDAAVTRSVLTAIEDNLTRSGVHEIRFASYDSPLSSEVLPQLAYRTCARNEYFFDLTRELSQLWNAVNRAKKRGVRKAQEYGIQTRAENTALGLELVERFHNMSMARRGIETRRTSPRKRAAQLELLSSGRIQVFVSYLEDEPVNAKMLGYFNGRACGLVSGSSELGNECWGPVHLTWTTLEWFKDDGATQLSLGGAKQHEEGLRTFKMEFGTIEQSQPTGTKSISRIGSLLAAGRRLLARR